MGMIGRFATRMRLSLYRAPYHRIFYQGAARGAGRWIIRLAHLLDGRFGPGRQKTFLRAFQAWDPGAKTIKKTKRVFGTLQIENRMRRAPVKQVPAPSSAAAPVE